MESVWNCGFQRFIGAGRTVYNYFYLSRLKPYFRSDSKFLEIGCGTGSLLKQLARFLPQFSVGLDIAENALIKGKSGQDGDIIAWFRDCFALPFPDNTFDIVWSQGLHEHFSAPEKIIAEEYRVCKPGGYVLIGVPHKYSYPFIWYLVTRPKNQKLLAMDRPDLLHTSRVPGQHPEEISPRATISAIRPVVLGTLIAEIKKEASVQTVKFLFMSSKRYFYSEAH